MNVTLIVGSVVGWIVLAYVFQAVFKLRDDHHHHTDRIDKIELSMEELRSLVNHLRHHNEP
jgi:hypothetical protein